MIADCFRYLEDEGFYVGAKPQIRPVNRNILENRLLQQPDRGQGWFGADGQVDMLPDPIKPIATKPWVEAVFEVDPNIETVYVKAIKRSVEDKYLAVSGHAVLSFASHRNGKRSSVLLMSGLIK